MKCERCGFPAQTSVPVHDSAINLCHECIGALQTRISFQDIIPKIFEAVGQNNTQEALVILDRFWNDNCSLEKEGWLGYSIQSFSSDVHARTGDVEQALAILRRLDTQCWHRLEGHVTNSLAATQLMSDTGKVLEAVQELEGAIERLNNYFLISLICLLKRYAALTEERDIEVSEAFKPLILYLSGRTSQGVADSNLNPVTLRGIIGSLRAPVLQASTF